MAAVSRPPPFDSGLKRWNPEDDGIYILNRGDLATERARLEYNHHRIWLPLCGGHLCPPHILAHLRGLPAPRVAEIATGTGVWLLDMAAQLPAAAELRGIDMDATKFPPASEAVPPNVSFARHNALEPFPEEMRGSFDMVHVRLISLGMRAGDWEVVARNLFTLLKPGGWLHWEEVADGGWRMVPPSNAFSEWLRVTALWSQKGGRDLLMPSRLPLLLKDVGFVDVDDKVYNTFGTRDMLEEPMKKIATQVVRPLMLVLLEEGGLDTIQTLDDVDRLDAEMKRAAAADDAKFGFYYNWTWGRRP